MGAFVDNQATLALLCGTMCKNRTEQTGSYYQIVVFHCMFLVFYQQKYKKKDNKQNNYGKYCIFALKQRKNDG
jgi:hypothetical protein